ncbi:hypothetical protein RND64_04565 [Gordonia sp. w5E2]|uniref:hypothetical protein n=1 Tax=Gordonia TaxID=2053 RepID=UPI002F4293A6
MSSPMFAVHEHVPDLTVEQRSLLAAEVDQVCANQVLWMVTGEEGYEPGGFRRKLYDLMASADPENLAQLTIVYPAESLAYSVAAFVPDGLDILRQAVRRG